MITESVIKHLTIAQAKKPTRTVKEGARQTNLKFRDVVVAQGKVFVPASLSTSGGFSPKFKQFFGDLVKHLLQL
jgi:hypothetical protein